MATIQTCFHLHQQQRKVTRAEAAKHLYLNTTEPRDAELKKAVDKVAYDLKKIKEQLLNSLDPESQDYQTAKDTFAIEHITDVFQTYAYFGLYPDQKKRYTSYLQGRLSKYR